MKGLVKTSVINNTQDSYEKFFPSKVIEKLNQLVDNIALCRGNELLHYDYAQLKEEINLLKDNRNLPASFIYLIEEIQNKIKSFNNDTSQLMLSIVEWCINHSLFQQAITLLQEFSITVVLNHAELEVSDQLYRKLVSQSFRIAAEKINEVNWKTPASENKELVNKFLEHDLIKNLFSGFSSLSDLRNDVNHAGFLKTSRNVSSIKSKLDNVIQLYKKYLL